MAKRATQLEEINRQLVDLKNDLHGLATNLESTLRLSESTLVNTDRQVTRLLRCIAIVFSVIALFTGGGLFFSFYTWISVQDEVESRVATQVPQQVAGAVQTAIPDAARYSAETQVAEEFNRLEATVEIQAATMVAEAVQTQLPPAAVTAVAEAEVGDYTIVVASENNLDAAVLNAEGLSQRGFDPKIYKIGEYYATTIGLFKTIDQLQSELLKARSEIVSSAYFLDLSVSCPYRKFFNAGFFGCSSESWD